MCFRLLRIPRRAIRDQTAAPRHPDFLHTGVLVHPCTTDPCTQAAPANEENGGRSQQQSKLSSPDERKALATIRKVVRREVVDKRDGIRGLLASLKKDVDSLETVVKRALRSLGALSLAYGSSRWP